MTTLEQATKALDVKPKELTPFDTPDPFNEHALRGFVCRRSDHRYGALYISHVDEKPVPQVVYCTPKFPYPVDKQGVFRFPAGVQSVHAYEKLDGTNIFGYKYRAWGGEACVTYKTRLLPVLGTSRFGPFLTYWREMLERYPDIPAAVLSYPGYGLSFELYGAKNKHLVIYDVPLDTCILFGVAQDTTLEPPPVVQRAVGHLPCQPPSHTLAKSTSDLVGIYRAMQAEMDANLTIDETLGGYRGVEGRVWYAKLPDTWAAFKCKPGTIEAIHWAAGGLGAPMVKATAYNVLENHDRCTPELVKELLLEEFNETEIDIAWQLILKVSRATNEEAELRERIFRLYKEVDIRFEDDAPAVMRALSPHFPRNRMQYVYSTLRR